MIFVAVYSNFASLFHLVIEMSKSLTYGQKFDHASICPNLILSQSFGTFCNFHYICFKEFFTKDHWKQLPASWQKVLNNLEGPDLAKQVLSVHLTHTQHQL